MSSDADRITSGFVNGDHSLVLSLQSQVESLKDMRVERLSFMIIGTEHRNVPLANLAAWQQRHRLSHSAALRRKRRSTGRNQIPNNGVQM